MTHDMAASVSVRAIRAWGAVMVLGLAACGVASPARAQARKSQLASVTQQVANTKVEIVYRRPVARGRALFGALVPYGKVWTPSADSAARITFSTPVTVNGSALAAGTYSIWAIPDADSWTVIFNATGAVFHLSYPDGKDVLRVRATPARGDHVETLEFSFPMADADSALMQLRWGPTIVPLMIRSTGGG